MVCSCVLKAGMVHLQWHNGYSNGLAINRSRVQILLGAMLCNNLGQVVQCSHLCASVTKQYNLVPAKGRWCSAVGEVTADLAEGNGSLPPGGWPVGWLPVHRDQLRVERLVSSMGSLYLFYGSFHLWMNIWAAGKTVWSLVNTWHTWASRDEQLIISAIQIGFLYLYLLLAGSQEWPIKYLYHLSLKVLFSNMRENWQTRVHLENGQRQ